MKQNKKIWIPLGIGSSIILILILIGSIIQIGEKLATIHIYLSYGFYALIILVTIFLIIIPLVKLLSAPSFKLTHYDDEEKKTKRKHANYKTLKKIALNLIESENSIPSERKEDLKKSLHNKKELYKKLEPIINLYIKKDISKIINRSGIDVFFRTAISQNNNLDAVAIIFANIQMVKKIVYAAGYRPTNTKMSILTVKVLRNVLISYGLNEANISNLVQMFLKAGKQSFEKMAIIIGPMVDMCVQGTANAFLTMRVGIKLRKFLFEEYNLSLIQDEELEIDEAERRIKELKDEVALMIKEDKINKKKNKEA